MANFDITYNKYIKPIEGGYVNHPSDKGGETYGGIARRFHPNYIIVWNVIDNYKNTVGPIKRNQKFPQLDAHVKKFYSDMFHNTGFHMINSQELADIIFDWYVNSGSSAFNTSSKDTFGVDEILAVKFGKDVPVDGKFDRKTLDAVNSVDVARLHAEIKSARENFYNTLVKKDPSQSDFINGWLRRIRAFPDLKKVGLGIGGILAVAGLFFLGYTIYKRNMAEGAT